MGERGQKAGAGEQQLCSIKANMVGPIHSTNVPLGDFVAADSMPNLTGWVRVLQKQESAEQGRQPLAGRPQHSTAQEAILLSLPGPGWALGHCCQPPGLALLPAGSREAVSSLSSKAGSSCPEPGPAAGALAASGERGSCTLRGHCGREWGSQPCKPAHTHTHMARLQDSPP